MSHRTKSGQRSKQNRVHQVKKRRFKRKRAILLAEGKIHKGQAPRPAA